MRAALIEELGRTPRRGEVASPERGGGQALVEITAAPMNPVDLSIAAGGFYAGDPELPYVPGVEGFGRVLEAQSLAPGTGVYVSRWARRQGLGAGGADRQPRPVGRGRGDLRLSHRPRAGARDPRPLELRGPGRGQGGGLPRMVEEAAAGRLTVENEAVPLDRIGEAWKRQAQSPHRKLVLTP